MHILLIARHYPPESSGGARRPYLYVGALRKLGHKVTIITPFHHANDPDSIQVEHPVDLATTDTSDGKGAAPSSGALRNLARQWLLWPDPDIRWVRRVRKKLKTLDINPDWLITTSPPESIHLIGGDMDCRWLAEFRDTWTVFPHREILLRSGFRRWAERKLAKNCLKSVNAVTSVSDDVMNEIRNYLPPATPELILGHFSDPPPEPAELPATDLNIVHTGGFTLSDRRRLLPPILEVLRQSDTPKLHLHIAGKLSAEETEYVKSETAFKITTYGTISLTRSRALQAGADALLLVTPENSHALPGKFAEYRHARRPIFYVGGGGWLHLVDDPSVLRPLETGLETLRKNEQFPPPKTSAMNADYAAAKLIEFLQNTETSHAEN